MPLRRAVTVSAGGVALVMLQALVLGNQWVSEWAFEHQILGGGLGAFLRNALFFPRWRLTPTGGFKYVFVIDLILAVLLVLLAGFTTLGVRTLGPERGAAAAFICGWWATFLAAAMSALFGQLLAKLFLDIEPFFRPALGGGLEYGLAAGWVLGLAVMGAYVFTRPKTAPEWSSEPPGEPAAGV
jgi:hypothetical protein